MTQRERLTPDEGASRPPAGRPAPPAPSAPASLWGEWYHRASPAQRQEAVERALRQGVLQAHQLPAPESASGPAAAGDASRRPPLTALLNGHIKDLESLHPPWPD